jgi:hypothetical protein
VSSVGGPDLESTGSGHPRVRQNRRAFVVEVTPTVPWSTPGREVCRGLLSDQPTDYQATPSGDLIAKVTGTQYSLADAEATTGVTLDHRSGQSG